MADTDEIPTLIFDEIDSGISGRTAQMVSQKMKLLAKTHQIICITHLPQIAAMADAHFLIEKSVEHASTVSRIHPLREEESIEVFGEGDHIGVLVRDRFPGYDNSFKGKRQHCFEHLKRDCRELLEKEPQNAEYQKFVPAA